MSKCCTENNTCKAGENGKIIEGQHHQHHKTSPPTKHSAPSNANNQTVLIFLLHAQVHTCKNISFCTVLAFDFFTFDRSMSGDIWAKNSPQQSPVLSMPCPTFIGKCLMAIATSESSFRTNFNKGD